MLSRIAARVGAQATGVVAQRTHLAGARSLGLVRGLDASMSVSLACSEVSVVTPFTEGRRSFSLFGWGKKEEPGSGVDDFKRRVLEAEPIKGATEADKAGSGALHQLKRMLSGKGRTRGVNGRVEYLERLDGSLLYELDEKALRSCKNAMLTPVGTIGGSLIALVAVNWPWYGMVMWVAAAVTSGLQIWRHSLRVTRVSVVHYPNTVDPRVFPRFAAKSRAAVAASQQAGAGKEQVKAEVAAAASPMKTTSLQIPAVKEYVVETYGFPFSGSNVIRAAPGEWKRRTDGTFTPTFVAPEDLSRASESREWERVVVSLPKRVVTLFLDQVKDLTLLNQFLAFAPPPANKPLDVEKFMEAWYPDFPKSAWESNPGVNPVLHESFNRATGLFRGQAPPSIESVTAAAAKAAETLESQQQRSPSGSSATDLHAAYRRARSGGASRTPPRGS